MDVVLEHLIGHRGARVLSVVDEVVGVHVEAEQIAEAEAQRGPGNAAEAGPVELILERLAAPAHQARAAVQHEEDRLCSGRTLTVSRPLPLSTLPGVRCSGPPALKRSSLGE